MYFHDSILILIAFCSEIVGTLSGFGSSTFFVPAAVLVESFQFVLVLTTVLHLFGNFSRLHLFRAHFHRKTFLLLAIPAVIFTVIGALLTSYIPSQWLLRALGIILIIISLLTLLQPGKKRRLPKWTAVPLSMLSGFSTGLVGTGGAIRGLAIATLQIQKNSFVVISAAIDISADLFRAIIYFANGYMDWSQWFYIPLFAAAAYLGAKVGKTLLSFINQNQFETIVSFFILLSGFFMIFS